MQTGALSYSFLYIKQFDLSARLTQAIIVKLNTGIAE